MSDWRTNLAYCSRCGQTGKNPAHRRCRKRAKGSHVLINPRELIFGCTKCGETWPLEDNMYYCSCGHRQPMEYWDDYMALEYGDELVTIVDDLAYVLKQTGEIAVVQREYLAYFE